MIKYKSCPVEAATSIFDQAYSQHSTELSRYARKLLKEDDNANDVVQRAFSVLYCKLLSGFKPDNCGAWLTGVVQKQVLMHQRQERNSKPHNRALSFERRSKDGDVVVHEPADSGRTPEQQAVRRETIQEVQKCLDRLSNEHREAIELTKVEGMTVDEACAALDVPLGTMKSRLRRATEELRNMLMRTDENPAYSTELSSGSS